MNSPNYNQTIPKNKLTFSKTKEVVLTTTKEVLITQKFLTSDSC